MSRNTSADIVAQQEDEARRRPRGRTVRPLLALVPFIMKYPGMIAGAFVALVIATLATLTMPIAVRFMIDRGFSRDDAGKLVCSNRSFLFKEKKISDKSLFLAFLH